MLRLLLLVVIGGGAFAADVPEPAKQTASDLQKKVSILETKLQEETMARQYWRQRAEEIMQTANMQIYTLGAQRAKATTEDVSHRFDALCRDHGKTFKTDPTTGEPSCADKPADPPKEPTK